MEGERGGSIIITSFRNDAQQGAFVLVDVFSIVRVMAMAIVVVAVMVLVGGKWKNVRRHERNVCV